MSDRGQAGQQECSDEATVVLVADDNDRYRSGIVRAIARRPEVARVLEASDGAEALALIRAKLPDVVLVDWRMPVLDGPSVARAVRQDRALSRIRVIVMSAADDEAFETAAREAGAVAFVDKTVPRSTICDVLLGPGGGPVA